MVILALTSSSSFCFCRSSRIICSSSSSSLSLSLSEEYSSVSLRPCCRLKRHNAALRRRASHQNATCNHSGLLSPLYVCDLRPQPFDFLLLGCDLPPEHLLKRDQFLLLCQDFVLLFTGNKGGNREVDHIVATTIALHQHGLPLLVCANAMYVRHLSQEEVDHFFLILGHFLFRNIFLREACYFLGYLTLALLIWRAGKHLGKRSNKPSPCCIKRLLFHSKLAALLNDRVYIYIMKAGRPDVWLPSVCVSGP